MLNSRGLDFPKQYTYELDFNHFIQWNLVAFVSLD